MKKKKQYTLKECMTARQRLLLGDHPTTHENCDIYIGVSRPGKTARDRLKRLQS